MYEQNGKYIIEWSDEKEIVELITSLAQLLEKGNTTIKFETEKCGDGNCEDGSNEYEWTEAKLVSEY